MPSGSASDQELAAAIARGAEALAIPLASSLVEAFVGYLRLVERWNTAYNLTAVRDVRNMVSHHLLDCLAATAALVVRRGAAPTRRVLDVGSGAGLPGLVIAAILPAAEVVCLDGVGKKIAFVAQAAGTMKLGNVRAVHGRVEQFRTGRFDVVTSRAFSSLADFVKLTSHVLDFGGEWMAMKGRRPDTELAALTEVSFHVEPLIVPGLAEQRCIVWMHRDSDRSLSGQLRNLAPRR